MLPTNRQASLTLLCKAPAVFLRDGHKIARVLQQVGLLIGTAFDSTTDGDGNEVVVTVHAWSVPRVLKSCDSCRW